jgi:hypothetical protein
MFRTTVIVALLIIPLYSIAQINRPTRTIPSTTAPPTSGAGAIAPTTTPDEQKNISVKLANGVEVKFLSAEGNATNQQVTLTWIMTNSKANLNVFFDKAFAVDTEGDHYQDEQVYQETQATLYTDVPQKGFRTLKGVPSKIQMLRLVKFDLHNRDTGVVVVVEFRNLKIDWK